MTKQDVWLVEKRAEQLAIMYLTRRSDLAIEHRRQEFGIDLLVSILQDGRISGRVMGVVLKASSTAQGIRHKNGRQEIALTRLEYSTFQNSPFPICLFFFTMEDDQGYWKWINEPIVDDSRNSVLVLDVSATVEPLDDEAIHRIVSTVNRWYDQRAERV